MLDSFKSLFKKKDKKEAQDAEPNYKSKEAAKERLHLVLMQDRANVSVDFLDMMKQEIIDVIKKYIEIDESEIDVRLTNKINEDGTNGAPALYANIPIMSIKNDNTIKKVAGMKVSELNDLKKQSNKQKLEENSKQRNKKEMKDEKKYDDKDDKIETNIEIKKSKSVKETSDNKPKNTRNKMNEKEEMNKKESIKNNEKSKKLSSNKSSSSKKNTKTVKTIESKTTTSKQ